MRRSYTRECGVTKELAPDAWQEINTGADRLRKGKQHKFQFFLLLPSRRRHLLLRRLSFRDCPLYGHTSGQVWPRGTEQSFFCADQVILGLTPIVITAGKDQHLLAEYFASLKELTADYTGYRFLPLDTMESSPRSARETDRIISEYETRCTQLRLALAESRRPMTL